MNQNPKFEKKKKKNFEEKKIPVRKDMGVKEHERISNITLGHKLK